MLARGHSQSYQLSGLGKSLPLTCGQQARLIYKRREYQPTQRVYLEHSAWEIGESVPLDYYIRPFYQDMDSRQLYLIYRKKPQEYYQNEEVKKYGPIKEQNKTPEKELKMKITNLSDAEFETLVVRMIKELSEYFNSLKMIQSEIKKTLIEIKNNLQGNNSREDEAKKQINDLEHKEEKDI